MPSWFLTDVTVEYTADRMASGARKFALKREVEELVGKLLEGSQYEQLRKAAREYLRTSADLTTAQRYHNAISILEGVISDEDTPHRTRIKALADLNDLLGVGARFSDSTSSEDKAEEVRQFLRETENGTKEV